MSERLIFGSCVKDPVVLQKTCDRLREQGKHTEGPKHVTNYPDPRQTGKKIDGHQVKLMGWTQHCVYTCNAAGEAIADNYSPYYDERPFNAEGERDSEAINPQTKQPFRVHPAVKDGSKKVGEDGRWGPIERLEELNQTYAAVALEQPVHELGGTITYKGVDEKTGKLHLTLEVPEQENLYA